MLRLTLRAGALRAHARLGSQPDRLSIIVVERHAAKAAGNQCIMPAASGSLWAISSGR